VEQQSKINPKVLKINLSYIEKWLADSSRAADPDHAPNQNRISVIEIIGGIRRYRNFALSIRRFRAILRDMEIYRLVLVSTE